MGRGQELLNLVKSIKQEKELQTIQEEIKEVIKPENIKKGVTAFGIEGISADTSDATADAGQLDKGLIAYGKNNAKLTGTGPVLNNTTEAFMLPKVYNYAGKGEVIKLTDYIPLVKDWRSGGDIGRTILFPTSKLPTDITNKNFILRLDTMRANYSGATVYYMTAYLCIAPSLDCHFEVRRDSSQDILRCWNATNTGRVNFQSYRISQYLGDTKNGTVNPGTLDTITADNWENRGSKYSDGTEYTNNNWYRFASHQMYNSGGLAQGTQYKANGDDCFLKTVMGEDVRYNAFDWNVRLLRGGTILSRIPNAEVAKAINLKAENIVPGYKYLGIEGAATIESFLEYSECFDLAHQIVTGQRYSPYEKLEYIEGTGTQYINTGVLPNQGTTSAEIEFQMTQTKSGEQWAFGQWYENGWRCGGSSGTLDSDRGFTYSSSTFTDRMIGTSAASTITAPYPMLLFCQQENGKPMYLSNGYVRIYRCKIWENEELIRDMVPVKVKANGQIGMYDLVNKVFYANVGSGTFVAGSVIEWTEEELA